MFARTNISNVVSWNAGSVAAAGIMLASSVLYMYFASRKRDRNAKLCYLIMFAAFATFFLFNGAPFVFKAIIVPLATASFLFRLYRFRGSA